MLRRGRTFGAFGVSRAARPAGVAVILVLGLVGAGVRAEASEPPETQNTPEVAPPTPVDSHTTDYVTRRYEPAGFPLLGGNSDIGFEVGAAGTITRFEGGQEPYLWKMNFLATASFKGDSGHTVVAQQNYIWVWDVPKLGDGHLRLTPLVYYQRTVDQGYFGLGNASAGTPPAGATSRYFQYSDNELRARQLARYDIGGGLEIVGATAFRAEAPTAYAGSLLAQNAAQKEGGSPLVRGVQEMGVGVLAGGILYDSRDNEIFPHSGAFHQIGLRAAAGLPATTRVGYGGAGADLRWAFPLGRDTVFAFRVVADLLAGNVPFYDLFTGGPFQTYDLIGGPSGVRGVPSGRYLGRIKVASNFELRSLPIGFRLFDVRFRVGGDVFIDTGRVWTDYTFDSPLDGHGIGLKYGAGGGLYLLWGQAALFRIEAAYSPDQVAENPGFPVGIYVEDGVMF
jgi:hypothetical protein